ncbi:MAG: hypothetical protein WC489_02895 [Patescibacteria group bacterium]
MAITAINSAKEGRPHRSESWNGVKFFKGNSIWDVPNLTTRAKQITSDHLRENKEVWRPEETVVAAIPFFDTGKVMVVGPPQSGKGTILFGLSEMCDELGIGYMFFNGHHQEVSGEDLATQIKRADEQGFPIFIDSYDYLFLGSRRTGRAISTQTQLERDDQIISALDAVTVPVALTFHDPEHSAAFMNSELIERYNWFHSKFPKYEIPLYLQSRDSVMRFLKDHDIPEQVAEFLIGLGENTHFEVAIEKLQPVVMDHRQLITSVNTYPVLKELVRDEKQTLFEIMEIAIQGPNQPGYEQALADLAALLEKAEKKRLGLTQERHRRKLKTQGNRK